MPRVCLIIIDGFGVAPPGPGNARTLAKMPTVATLESEVPNVLMEASGNAVGLPEGQQGASEPGHLTMGAGRVVWQPLENINRAIREGDFFENPVLIAACERAKEKNVPLHLLGLYSSGGVHSHLDHMHAMLRLAKQKGVAKVFLHLVGDGRDMPEQYFCTDFDLLKKEISKEQLGTIASLVGRYFAMDRDKQYVDRTKVAYDLLAEGKGEDSSDFCASAKQWYIAAPDKQKTDYYIRPLKTKEFQPVQGKDVVVCVNFRSDRMIQIVRALEEENFAEFPRPVRVTDVVCMGPYSNHLPVAFPAQEVLNTLGSVVSKAGIKQLRVAETDKFAHVTFFFNAQEHEPYKGEDRLMVESPKVANFAEAPEMSADQITETVLGNIKDGTYGLIVMNYANPDLVGHGGKLDAAVKACETVDRNLAKLLPALEAAGYDWIVTADHGNAECMLLEDGATINPSHTTSPIQTFVHSSIIKSSADLKDLKGLKDIAPLCLKIMGIPVPKEMQ
ncbi:phosphoglycerate mutase (2,3-diphosphoglycerate-independent) [Candidatus Peribacteria bacterium RIFCSPHIGHO2_01_FULL_55_13]|nr:MAG: phosphoglycerate mutase (2,3-diphosphoglycerate-independent) [Candidatus Peribacteria bacterium RIFCSPHIGHO2_01_FULL_55_13]